MAAKGTTSDIVFERKYNGLTLNCDESSFVRLCNFLGEEPSVCGAITEAIQKNDVRFVTIRRSCVPLPEGSGRWLNGVFLSMAICLSGIPTVIGYVVITRWLLMRISG